MRQSFKKAKQMHKRFRLTDSSGRVWNLFS